VFRYTCVLKKIAVISFGINQLNSIMKAASELSRRELDDLRAQYEEALRGPMWQQQVAITCAMNYFKSIPKADRTPELGALEEIFCEVGGEQLWDVILDDLEMMGGEFVTPELQNEEWFSVQYLFHSQVYRLKLYYPLAQELAARYGFELPNGTDIAPYSYKSKVRYYDVG
jgi:hypothetical protein